MMWFPDQQQIPSDYNVKPSMEPGILLSILDKNSRMSLKTDDLTFIIPVGLDSEDRAFNLSVVLTFLMTNTTAKIKLVWSESKESISKSPAFFALTNGQHHTTEEVIEFFEKNSSDKFVNRMFSQHPVPGRNSLPLNLLLFSIIPSFARVKIGSSGGWNDLVSGMPSGSIPPDITQTRQFQSYIREAMERIEISVILRGSDAPFNRMKYINMALENTQTELVCNHDTDVILDRTSLLSTLYQLRSTDCDFVYPYEHMATAKSQRRIFKSGEEDELAIYRCAIFGDTSQILNSVPNIAWPSGYGQSIFAKTRAYKSAGGENENFISWGAEDVERYMRFCKFGYKVQRSNIGVVLHLEHERGPDSSNSNPHFKANEALWSSLQNLSSNQLLEVYKGYDYMKEYGFNVSLRGA